MAELFSHHAPALSHVWVQDEKSLTDILQNIQVNRVHTVHAALAVLDGLALSMQVSNIKCTACH